MDHAPPVDSRDAPSDRERTASTPSDPRIHDAPAPDARQPRVPLLGPGEWEREPQRQRERERERQHRWPATGTGSGGLPARTGTAASTQDGAIAAASDPADVRLMSAPALSDTVGLVVGVANKRSISWAIASAAAAAGAQARADLPGRPARRKRSRAGGLARRSADRPVRCDERDRARCGLRSRSAKRYGRLDFVVHGVAFADRDDLARPFVETGARRFSQGARRQRVLARRADEAGRAAHGRRGGGSILTLSYLGASACFRTTT